MSRILDQIKAHKGLLIICAIVFAALFVVLVTVARTSYTSGYWDGMRYQRNTTLIASQSVPSDNGSTYILGHVSTVRYGLATADPSKLWGLEQAYDNHIIGGPFDVPLVPCTVYLVTVDDNGQQAIVEVPADQVPSQYDGFVAGCDPASVTPWWVADQFAQEDDLGQLPTLGDNPDPGTSNNGGSDQ